MPPDNQNPNNEPQEGVNASGEGGGNGAGTAALSNEEVVRLFNTQTGRHFKSVDDIVTSIKEASTLAESKGAVEEFAKANGMTYAEATTFLKDYKSDGEPGKPAPSPAPNDQLNERLTHVEQTIRENDLFTQHPEYRPHMELIREYAKSKGGDVLEAVKDEKFSKALNTLVAKDQEDRDNKGSVLRGNQRVAPATPEYNAAFDRAKKSGDWSEVLRLKGALPQQT